MADGLAHVASVGYAPTMGADTTAAWIGAIVLAALSFTPAIMAPTWKARHTAGRVARLSLWLIVLTTVWTTLTALELTPPQGGVVASGLTVLLAVPSALAVWGLALMARSALRGLLGWGPHASSTLVVGAGRGRSYSRYAGR